MGRTNPTYRDFLAAKRDAYADFRRGLRRRHQPRFDALFEKAQRHADAAGLATELEPERAMLVSMLLAQEAELHALRTRVAEAEETLERLAEDADERERVGKQEDASDGHREATTDGG